MNDCLTFVEAAKTVTVVILYAALAPHFNVDVHPTARNTNKWKVI